MRVGQSDGSVASGLVDNRYIFRKRVVSDLRFGDSVDNDLAVVIFRQVLNRLCPVIPFHSDGRNIFAVHILRRHAIGQ